MEKLIRKGIFLLLDKSSHDKEKHIKYFGYFDIQEITNYYKKYKKIFYYSTSDKFFDCEIHYIVGNIL